MKTFLASLVMLLCSVSAFATSYTSGEVAGFFGWNASLNSGGWVVRIPGLPPHIGGSPFMYGSTFSDAILSVNCNLICAVGDSFSTNLAMTNFKVSPYFGGVQIGMFVGTLNLITKPIVLTASSGIAIARFSLTGDLLACNDATCSTQLFTLAVNVHGYAKLTYNLTNGKLSISSIRYTLPEPSSMTLLGTGLLLMIGRLRQTARRRGE
jgi:hypothetical protein